VRKIKGLILAGGLALRLRPFSHTLPKQLIPIANKPVLHYIVEDLVNSGITDIGVIVGYTPERIKFITDSLGDGSKFGAKINYIEQDAPRGLAHAVGISQDFIGDDNFVVYLGDNLLQDGISKYVKKFENSDADIAIILKESHMPEKFGVALLNEKNEIIDIEEKPQNPKSNLVVIGVYFLRPSIFDVIKDLKPGKKGEYQITDAIKEFVKSDNHKVMSYILDGWWADTGDADDIIETNHYVLMNLKKQIKGELQENVKIIGNVEIGEGTIIKDNTLIKGPVIIGKNCEIGPDTYIGPYTSIGDNNKIICKEIESSIIFDNTNINFDGRIYNSLIGKESKINSEKRLPNTHSFIIGDNSEVRL
jgi:glucose-1-phosphate thymidylyltransferase